MRRRLAWVAWIGLAGCGGSSGSAPDAPSTIDAATIPDAVLAGPVTVTIREFTGPSVGWGVVFSEADGSTAAERTTDNTGSATADLHPGGAVTVVNPGTDFLDSIFDVEPGDHIVVGPTTSGPVVGTFTVTVPYAPGSTHVLVYTPCSDDSVPTTSGTDATDPISITANCQMVAADVLAVAADGTGTAIAWSAATADIVPDGSVQIPATWTPLGTFSVNLTDIPAAVTQIDLQDSTPYAYQYGLATSQVPSGGALTYQAPMVIGTPTAAVKTHYQANGIGHQDFYEIVDGTHASYDLDVGAALLPWIPKATFSKSGSGLVTYGGALSGDLMNVHLGYATPAAPNVNWTIETPPSSSVQLPALPADLQRYALASATGTVFISTSVCDADDITSWTDVRSNPDGVLDPYSTGRRALGRVRCVSY